MRSNRRPNTAVVENQGASQAVSMKDVMLSGQNKGFRNVGLFVDWNSQLLNTPEELNTFPIEKCRLALQATGKAVTKALCALSATDIFRVQMRLYHGWTIGVCQTANRRAFASLTEFDEPDSIFPSSRVLAKSDIEFGDRLIDALPERENKGLRVHLPNTLRRQNKREPYTEKMVDTALAVDLLSWARAEPNSIAVVISPDDDLVPPVFIAEAWMKPLGGKVILIRSRANESRFLALEGLVN